MSYCSKPRCKGRAEVVLAYDYAAREVALEASGEGPVPPHLYGLCAPCADRLSPPRGWALTDKRIPALH